MLPYRAAARRYSAHSLDSYKLDYLGTFTHQQSAAAFEVPILLGKPDPRRELFLLVWNQGGTGRTLDSAGLPAASGAIQSGQSVSSTSGVACVRFSDPTPAASALLALTFSGTVSDGIYVAVFRTANRAVRAADATDTSSGIGVLNSSITNSAVTVQPRGFWIGMCGHGNTNPTSVSGADSKSDTTLSITVNVAGLSLNNGAAVTPSVQWSWSGATTCRQAAWSFGYAP